MIRQYGAQRRHGGPNPLRVGTIPVGAIFYLQDESWRRDRYRGAPVCRTPWIVEAFLNGLFHASRRNRETGRWESTFAAGRSDMAVIRSLRDGRRQEIAIRTLVLHEDEGLAAQPIAYPSMPDLRFYRATDHHHKEKPAHAQAIEHCIARRSHQTEAVYQQVQ